MARYIARVELRGEASSEDYDKLHAALAAIRCYQTMAGSDGIKRGLPHATYCTDAFTNATVASQAILQAAKSVWEDPILIVPGSDINYWLYKVE